MIYSIPEAEYMEVLLATAWNAAVPSIERGIPFRANYFSINKFPDRRQPSCVIQVNLISQSD